jgi:quercetin dioxygenase-like cupin family protein
MTSTLQSPAIPRDIWYLGTLLHLRATGADTGGAYGLVEEHLRRNLAPPRHTHTREDEAFIVLDGELTFWLGEQRFTAVAGQSAFLPRGVEHTFRVDSVTAHVLNIVSPAGFEQFFVDFGEPAQADELPPAPDGPPDVARMAALLASYGVRLNGPPPTSDD